MFRPMLMRGPVAQGAAFSAWSATEKSPDYTLSNNNRTATKAGGTNGSMVRGTKYIASGKVYAEAAIESAAAIIRIGLSNANVPIDGSQLLGLSDNGNGIGYYSNGRIFYNGSSALYDDYTNGDVVGIALDASARTINWYKNGAFVTTSSAIPPGSLALTLSNNSSDLTTVTINTGQTAFAFTPPSGFSAWG